MSGARARQRLRTRKDLMQAATRLLREGRTPTFEEIAEAALVSRATAYRYFSGLDELLREAALDVAVPAPEVLFGPDAPSDIVDRLERLDAALFAMIAANETPMRLLLAQSLQLSVASGRDPAAPVRQNRRGPLIAEALAPARGQFAPRDLDRLAKALVLLLGVEAEVVFKDVVRVDAAEAAGIRRWMIRALVDAARKD
jgi:AcrR family transcriptional regulator